MLAGMTLAGMTIYLDLTREFNRDATPAVIAPRRLSP